MRIANVHGFDAQHDSGISERQRGVRQPLIIRVPAEQSAKEAHVRALAFMRGGQRSSAIKLHQHLRDFSLHQITRQPPDAQRRRTV